ncbi:MAG TPA: tRNA (guanosine(37)-N1)-methyltransferase TrmD [Patescibacteria group bacterium]|nr:tRNA (guanosine(37)-N1)-methyltransferase TrmD [Patescibacteria group bacterium]
MNITILTLFPEMFAGPFSESILKRAQEKNAINIKIVNIRDFATDKHHVTDQPPYGGGPGMVMMVEPIAKAIESLKLQVSSSKSKTVLLSAKGELHTQAKAKEYSELDELILICGHYEGVDERVREFVDEEVRIGDYVLTGGEIPAMAIADSVIRLLPGVLGDDMSSVDESHSEPGYFEYPQYTRPADYMGHKVPDVLLGGNHGEIAKWRSQQAKHAEGSKGDA